MSEERLLATLEACDAATAAPYRRWKGRLDERLATRFGCGAAELRPWHYGDPFFQDVPIDGGVDLDPLFAGRDVVQLAATTLGGLGLDVEDVLSRSDLMPREGKCQHAFSTDIDRRGDVRILANVAHNARWADTMLHELGHAAFSTGHDPALPFLLRDAHLTLTEGVAILLGDLAGRREWLEGVVGADVDAAGVGARLDTARAAERLLFTRWVLVMTSFERALYADPDADLDAVWWELVARHQGLTAPDRLPVGGWASKIHLGVAPVYYHTYLYGHLVAAQLRATLAQEAGGLVGCEPAGAMLAERLFAPGESSRWDRLLERVTGHPLDVRPFAAELDAAA
jgi:peptidyl-dipeptidase A